MNLETWITKGNLSASFDFPIRTGPGFYFLCTCLSRPFLREQTQSAGYLERILTYSVSGLGTVSLLFPQPPWSEVWKHPDVLLSWWKSRRQRQIRFCGLGQPGDKRWVGLLLGMVGTWHFLHWLPACPYSHPCSGQWACCPSPLIAARATMSVAAGLCTEVSCMLSVADCKMWSQPFTPHPPPLYPCLLSMWLRSSFDQKVASVFPCTWADLLCL